LGLVCRICLGQCENEFNIFEVKHGTEASIASIISECTGLKVEKGDHLPETFCTSCCQDAQNAFEFRKTHQRS